MVSVEVPAYPDWPNSAIAAVSTEERRAPADCRIGTITSCKLVVNHNLVKALTEICQFASTSPMNWLRPG
jgi:hypothetical protein